MVELAASLLHVSLPDRFPGILGRAIRLDPYNNNYNNNDNNGNDDSLYGPYSSNGYTGTHQSTPFALGTPVTDPVTANVAISAPTVLVYLKDGTMLAANDYWLADGQFHYTVKYGGENVIGMDQVDVQKSIDENLKRGVKFTLKARPAMASGGAGDASGAKVDAGRGVERGRSKQRPYNRTEKRGCYERCRRPRNLVANL